MQYSEIELQEQLTAANAMAGDLIPLAERLFGPMCSSWKYVGVIFRDHPPHLYYGPDTTTVQISLSLRAVNDEFQRDFQLAHEICHLLYPSVDPKHPAKPETNLINEGISTYFSIIVVAAFHGEDAAQNALESLETNSPRYFFAFQQVSDLMSKDRNAIKKIRDIQPKINNLSKVDLFASGLTLTDETISALLAVF